MSRSPRPLEFFVDRSLGRHRVPEALRLVGWTLRTHHEVYGERDEEVPDIEWLELCGRCGLPVLSKDRRLRHRPAEIEAIRRFGVNAFLLTSGNLLAAEQAERFDRNREGIERSCSAAGPSVYAVQAVRIVKMFPS
ncbi:MAG TPA: hypothetical protein VMS02_03595 [Solirubrobacteraceae bacterium]|nr:hypothetical protein [Solirubrobacteraceae bacterium]